MNQTDKTRPEIPSPMAAPGVFSDVSPNISPNISLDAPLDELLDWAQQRFGTRFEPLTVGGTTLEIIQISDMPALVDKLVAAAGPRDRVELPLWARIWPASVLLAYFIHRLPARDRTLLEIGSGVGVAGLFAAALGMRATITDVNPDALLFSRINVLHNGLADRAEVRRADFSLDRLGRCFDYILGSEVLYLEGLHQGLTEFLLAHIERAPHAQIILCRDYRRDAVRFFELAKAEFLMDEKTVGCKADDPEDGVERFLCSIHRLRPRPAAD